MRSASEKKGSASAQLSNRVLQGTFLIITIQSTASRRSRRSGIARDRTCCPVAIFCASMTACRGRETSLLAMISAPVVLLGCEVGESKRRRVAGLGINVSNPWLDLQGRRRAGTGASIPVSTSHYLKPVTFSKLPINTYLLLHLTYLSYLGAYLPSI